MKLLLEEDKCLVLSKYNSTIPFINCNAKVSNLFDYTNSGIIFLIAGSGNFGPAVA